MTNPLPHSRRLSWQGIVALIIVAASARFLPHLPLNFSPVGAMGIYAGTMLAGPTALLVSLTGLGISDLVLGFYHPVTMLFVYLGLALNVGTGHLFCRGHRRLTGLILAPFTGAILFFLSSNFGVWLAGEIYPYSLTGFINCFVAALPFFGNTLASNLLFSFALFGLDYTLGFYLPVRKRA